MKIKNIKTRKELEFYHNDILAAFAFIFVKEQKLKVKFLTEIIALKGEVAQHLAVSGNTIALSDWFVDTDVLPPAVMRKFKSEFKRHVSNELVACG
jgi:hypothetical protein|tara:strand:+ start:2087 stop:2374 length:288 start_codon:yes stop_codon:yes gene_type:complete